MTQWDTKDPSTPKVLAKIWQITGCNKDGPRYLKLILTCMAFRAWYRKSKVDHESRHNSGYLCFGRTWTPNCWHQVSFWGTPKNLGYYSDAANMNNYWGTLSASYFTVVNHNFTQTTIEVKCSTISYAMRAIWTNHQHCRYLDKCHLNPSYILYNRGTSLTCNCHNLIRIVFLPTLCLNHFL